MHEFAKAARPAIFRHRLTVWRLLMAADTLHHFKSDKPTSASRSGDAANRRFWCAADRRAARAAVAQPPGPVGSVYWTGNACIGNGVVSWTADQQRMWRNGVPSWSLAGRSRRRPTFRNCVEVLPLRRQATPREEPQGDAAIPRRPRTPRFDAPGPRCGAARTVDAGEDVDREPANPSAARFVARSRSLRSVE